MTRDSGVRVVDLAAFACGLPVREEERRGPESIPEVASRARAALARRPAYALLNANCEHLAREVFSGERLSRQANLLVLIGLVVLGCWIARSA